MLRPAYRVRIGDRVVDTTVEPRASTAVDLDVRLDMDTPSEAFTLLQGQVGGLPAVVGDSAEVALGYADDPAGLTTVLTGVVTGVEPGVETHRITGLSAQGALLRTSTDSTFQDTTAGDVVRALADLAGLEVARVDDGVALPAYVVDGRRNASRHVRALAGLCGFDTYVTPAGGLVFEAFAGPRTVHVLTFGEHVLELELARRRPEAAAVQVFGESPGSSRGDESWAWLTKDFTPRRGSAGSGAPVRLLEESALRTAASAATTATATQDRLTAQSLTGSLRVQGRPRVALGDLVRLERFPASERTGDVDGSYQVRSVHHRISKVGGFVTDVAFRSLAGTAATGDDVAMTTIVDTIAAIVRSELSAVRTTELGLVDAVHPHSSGADDENYGCDITLKNSGLQLVRVPVATGHVGTVAIPNVGDLVLVAFHDGDVNAPLVIGRLYDDVDRPPLSTSDEVVFRLPLAEPDDKTVMAAIRNHAGTNPPRELVIEMPPTITVRIVDGVVTATAGQTELKLDQSGASGGTVTVSAGRTTITMDQDGDVLLDSAAAVTLRAASDLTLQAGGNVSIEAGGSATMQAGTRATVKGSFTAALEGTAAATVQGAQVSVKGLTSFSP